MHHRSDSSTDARYEQTAHKRHATCLFVYFALIIPLRTNSKQHGARGDSRHRLNNIGQRRKWREEMRVVSVSLSL